MRYSLLSILGIGFWMVAACSSNTDNSNTRNLNKQPANLSSVSSSKSEEIVIPKRIISASPNLTEIVAALDGIQRLVGVTQYCSYPPEVKNLPTVGNAFELLYEKIVQLEPDLVLLLNTQEKMQSHLTNLNIPTMQFGNNRVSEIIQSIERLGSLLNQKEKAQTIITELQTLFSSNQEKSASETRNTPAILLIINREQGSLKKIMGVGKDNFLHDLIGLAGGSNWLENAATTYPEVSLSTILDHPPDIIIETSGISLDSQQKEDILALWLPYAVIPAVKNKQIYLIDDPTFTIPSHRIKYAFQKLEHILMKYSEKNILEVQE